MITYISPTKLEIAKGRRLKVKNNGRVVGAIVENANGKFYYLDYGSLTKGEEMPTIMHVRRSIEGK